MGSSGALLVLGVLAMLLVTGADGGLWHRSVGPCCRVLFYGCSGPYLWKTCGKLLVTVGGWVLGWSIGGVWRGGRKRPYFENRSQ